MKSETLLFSAGKLVHVNVSCASAGTQLNQRSPLTTSDCLGSDISRTGFSQQLLGGRIAGSHQCFSQSWVFLLCFFSKNIHESASFDRQLTGLNVNTCADTLDKSSRWMPSGPGRITITLISSRSDGWRKSPFQINWSQYVTSRALRRSPDASLIWWNLRDL